MKQLTELPRLRTSEDSALAIHNLEFSYPDQPAVLDQLNFKIEPGERVGLIGPNGAGKTTFFLSTCGILKPTAGEIFVFGEPIHAGEFNPNIGLVFQNPDDQLFCPTVWEDVAFGPENLQLSPVEVKQRVEEALSITRTYSLAQRVPHHLSGGQKCMVAIATVLAMHPQLILYDEPSANLDLSSRRRLIDFLEISEQTIIISSHDLELILEVCDRVLLLNEGQIIADGDPHRVMGNQRLMESNGLEKPHSLFHHPPGAHQE
ncbi:MAG: ATP-binding cassette domain-containing protein [Cyanobacteria bacterium]|jgi:cobalt/nickel transport system ATP-binding protein|nr:ATP-binding cassette domain-containing protein [Cyanobacteria bacterium GSL.Bin21]